jgi:hypothetical protein
MYRTAAQVTCCVGLCLTLFVLLLPCRVPAGPPWRYCLRSFKQREQHCAAPHSRWLSTLVCLTSLPLCSESNMCLTFLALLHCRVPAGPP